jgi:hypothetical protein
MNNLGFSGGCLGQMLSIVLQLCDEVVVVHHITNHTDYVQLEIERRGERITFERMKLTLAEFKDLLTFG